VTNLIKTGWVCTVVVGTAVLAAAGCDLVNVERLQAAQVDGTFERTLSAR